MDNNDVELIRSTSDKAGEVLDRFFANLGKISVTADDNEPGMFYPNGIELILFKVNISGIDIEFRVAGAKGVNEIMALSPDIAADGPEQEGLKPG